MSGEAAFSIFQPPLRFGDDRFERQAGKLLADAFQHTGDHAFAATIGDHHRRTTVNRQVGGQNLASEFVQKSQIAALDVTYDVTSKLTLGGKYAYRLGQVSLDREDPTFFDNNASLYVLRGDYRFRENWEVLLETRLLEMPDLGEHRVGALTAVSRYFGDHIKVGLGYNFTDFSDDLTDLNYDHQGFFLNVTGTL